MKSRRFARAATFIFVAINVVGALYAAAMGEGRHAGVHVVLLIVGIGVLSRLVPRESQGATAFDTESDARIDRMQKVVDAMAVDVERIGEAQRYATRLAAARLESAKKGGGSDAV